MELAITIGVTIGVIVAGISILVKEIRKIVDKVEEKEPCGEIIEKIMDLLNQKYRKDEEV